MKPAEVVLVPRAAEVKAVQVSLTMPRTQTASRDGAPQVGASAPDCLRIAPCSSAAADALAPAHEVRRGHRST